MMLAGCGHCDTYSSTEWAHCDTYTQDGPKKLDHI